MRRGAIVVLAVLLAVLTLTPEGVLAAPDGEASESRATDVTSPAGRDITDTAFSLPKGVWEVQVGILGVSTNDLFGNVGIYRGFGHGIQLGANLLHAGAGLFNLALDWTFLDRERWALAVGFHPSYAHGSWLWLLSDENEIVGDLDLFILPLSLTGSVLPMPWLQFDLMAEFMDSEVLGNANGNSLIFDAHLAARRFSLDPAVRIHLMKRVSLYVTSRLPLWTRVPGSVEGEAVIAPGVIVGGRSSGSRKVPFSEQYLVTWGVRSVLAKGVFANFALNYGGGAELLYGHPLYPRFSMHFRF
jgi:hypothetical protein